MKDANRTLQALILEIETNRQRLDFAMRTKNESLQNRTLSLLVSLQAAFFDAMKKEFKMERKSEPSVLVFSERYQDGVRLTLTQYRQLTREMSADDRATHVCIEIEQGMEEAVEQAIVLDSAERRRSKAG